MKIEAVKSELKIILKGRLEDCFDVLSTIIKKDIVAYNEFVQLRSNATRIAKQYYLNEIDVEQYNREVSKLTNGVLSYIDNISMSDIDITSFDKDKLPPVSKIKPNSVGLLLGDFNVELKKVIGLIDGAEIIRAIGFGRQYKIEGNTLPVVEKYYNAIEDRLLRKVNGKAFHYRRITVQKLEERFREHIKKCFRNVRGNSNECGMVFRESLYLSLRYLVIDDKKMILNLYTRDNVGIQDNRMLFHTEDKSIIEYFITHFDDAWDNERYKGNVINTEEDFERFIPVNEKLYENLDKIKRHIREIYNNSITSIHANSYLMNTVSQTEHLRFNYLVVKHKKKNSELENIFRWYMENLNEDCSYKTLSFIEFWDDIVENGSFIRKNKLALETRARVERIFVVDNTQLNEEEYLNRCRLILSENFELACDHPNYQFKIYFSDRYQWCLEEYRNCSIWQNKYERVIFLSDYKKEKTTLYFINENEGTKRNIKKLNKTQDSIRHVNDEVKKQFRRLSKEKIDFLESCHVDTEKYKTLMNKYFS